MASADRVVLDASAVVAFARGESGASRVSDVLHAAAINAVNVAECAAVLGRFMPIGDAVRKLARLGLTIVACEWDLAVSAAEIHAASRDRGLSLGDCMCLATAKQLGVAALTCDSGWRELNVGVKVEMLR